MKKALWLLAVVVLVGALAPPAHARVTVTISGFYDELSPYGQWVTADRWGTCWHPSSVSASWQPYLNGEWIYTDYGLTWVSYDAWGGDPYHYGSWVWDPEYGWVWVPGTVWSPAWVTWSWTDTYIGWAPISPTFGFSYTGYSGAPVVASSNAYVFVPSQQLLGVAPATVRVPSSGNTAILSSARPATRFAVTPSGALANTALAPAQLTRLTGRSITPVSVTRAKTQPVSVRASGVKGGRLTPVTPAPLRAAALQTRLKKNGEHGAPTTHTSSRVAPSARGPERVAPRQHAAPHERAVAHGRAMPQHAAPRQERVSVHETRGPRAHAAAPVSRHDTPRREMRVERSEPRHDVKVERHEAAPPRHDGPIAHREAPPQQIRHEAPPPQVRREAPVAPPQHRDPPPQQAMRVEHAPPAPAAAPVRHEAPPQAHGGGRPAAPPPREKDKEHGPH